MNGEKLTTKDLHVTDLTALGHLDQYHYGGIQAGAASARTALAGLHNILVSRSLHFALANCILCCTDSTCALFCTFLAC